MPYDPETGLPLGPPEYTGSDDSAPALDEPKSDTMECPECHVPLENMNHRKKHAITHFGVDPLPKWAHNEEPRRRKAALLNIDPKDA